MSPWVLPERTLGTVRYTETYPGNYLICRTVLTLHRTLTVPVPSTTYVAIFEIHMYRPPSFISV